MNDRCIVFYSAELPKDEIGSASRFIYHKLRCDCDGGGQRLPVVRRSLYTMTLSHLGWADLCTHEYIGRGIADVLVYGDRRKVDGDSNVKTIV